MSDQTFFFNLIEVGHFAAYLAMVVALVQGLAPLLARQLRMPALAGLTVNASVVVFVLTTLGGLTLIHAFVTSNFSVLPSCGHPSAARHFFAHSYPQDLWVSADRLRCLTVILHQDRRPTRAAGRPAVMVQGGRT